MPGTHFDRRDELDRIRISPGFPLTHRNKWSRRVRPFRKQLVSSRPIRVADGLAATRAVRDILQRPSNTHPGRLQGALLGRGRNVLIEPGFGERLSVN
jgi:hypothetical protein